MKPVDLMAEVPLEIVLNSHSKRKTSTAVSYFEAVGSLPAEGPKGLSQQGYIWGCKCLK